MPRGKPAPVHFDSLVIRGFRRLAQLTLHLRPLTVVIGANGSGKTSLLEALSLLSASAQPALSLRLSELGGLSSLLTRIDRPARQLQLGISTAAEQGRQMTYDLTLRPSALSYSIEAEELNVLAATTSQSRLIQRAGAAVRYLDPVRKKLVSPQWDQNPIETSLGQVPRDNQPIAGFRARLASFVHYHTLDVGPRSYVRFPQPMRPALLPGRNGEDLVNCLFSLQQSHRQRFEEVEDVLRVAFPRFQRLEFPPVAAGTFSLAWRETGKGDPFYLNELSEGTLRFLWLISLLHSPETPALVLLDEPEVSLHPELLRILVDVLRDASLRSQLVVATHSDRLVRFLKPEEVLTVDLDQQGFAEVKWGDELDLEHWLTEYSMDQLWQDGVLGARP